MQLTRIWAALPARRVPPKVAEHALNAAPSKEVASASHEWLKNALLLLGYIFADSSIYFAGDFAHLGDTPENSAALLLMKSLLSAVVGVAASLAQQPNRPALVVLNECCGFRNVLRMLHVSACFFVSGACLLQAFSSFDGAFIKLISQAKLPLTALLAVVLLGQKYTAAQWQVICLVCVACILFTALKIGTVSARGAGHAAGLLLVAVSISGNVLGNLFAELAFKRRGALPFSAVMTNIRLGEMLSAAAMLFWLVGPTGARNIFAQWNWTIAAVLAAMLADTWLSGLVVVRMSSLVKGMAKCGSLVVVYMLALMAGKQSFALPQVLSAVVIVQLTALFATISRSAPPQLERRRGT